MLDEFLYILRRDDKSLKMTTRLREEDSAAASSRLGQQGLKHPRIVCVPRELGGKDRHSKVSTIRGLRDRRVRLSVQTAIQLYDLQDKLGVKQPSKVVDWLLNAARHEIDKLPPLPFFPPASFSASQFSQKSAAALPSVSQRTGDCNLALFSSNMGRSHPCVSAYDSYCHLDHELQVGGGDDPARLEAPPCFSASGCSQLMFYESGGMTSTFDST